MKILHGYIFLCRSIQKNSGLISKLEEFRKENSGLQNKIKVILKLPCAKDSRFFF